jgi:hypothetical protein
MIKVELLKHGGVRRSDYRQTFRASSAQDLPLGSLEGEKEIKPVPPFNLHEFMQTAKLPIFAS